MKRGPERARYDYSGRVKFGPHPLLKLLHAAPSPGYRCAFAFAFAAAAARFIRIFSANVLGGEPSETEALSAAERLCSVSPFRVASTE